MTEIELEGYNIRYTQPETAEVLIDDAWVALPELSTPEIDVDQLDLSNYINS